MLKLYAYNLFIKIQLVSNFPQEYPPELAAGYRVPIVVNKLCFLLIFCLTFAALAAALIQSDYF
jgi:hypothetical protein